MVKQLRLLEIDKDTEFSVIFEKDGSTFSLIYTKVEPMEGCRPINPFLLLS
jgi:hypothetical protein